ncbi:hypothetical protein, conserved [Plasmodium gonderi]|uniref:CTLH domain-containing protein n=1 Tax=Plasmodium gonderi TaxID=77519 RepID=A0A1Y1JJ47_PLAGO|nr:hypothetical protein, conserved [Plasmodium gonderi]GAW82260.1 hypothetical protein, conserved [Plasmodium gonderi]
MEETEEYKEEKHDQEKKEVEDDTRTCPENNKNGRNENKENMSHVFQIVENYIDNEIVYVNDTNKTIVMLSKKENQMDEEEHRRAVPAEVDMNVSAEVDTNVSAEVDTNVSAKVDANVSAKVDANASVEAEKSEGKEAEAGSARGINFDSDPNVLQNNGKKIFKKDQYCNCNAENVKENNEETVHPMNKEKIENNMIGKQVEENEDEHNEIHSNGDIDTWSNLSYLSLDEEVSMYNETGDANMEMFKEEQTMMIRKQMKRRRRRLRMKLEEEEEQERNMQREVHERVDETKGGIIQEKGSHPPVGESAEAVSSTNSTSEVGESKEFCLNAIDKSFIQIPLKCILNSFRNIQKELEKNFTIITLFIEKKLLNLTDEIYLNKLNTILEKLEALRNKVMESKVLLDKYVNRLVSRLKYVYFEGDIQLENLKHDFRFETYENRINWLIDGFLARYGFFDTAEIFSKRYKLENYSDADVYKEYLEIINELKKHNMKPALEWCQKYKSQLKKIDSNIEAELHLQHIINIIYENKFFEAIEYIKKTVPNPDEHISTDVKYLITYIGLYGSNESQHTIESLKRFNKKRWVKVIKSFQKVYSEITGVLNKPLLELLLKAGISVVKTDQCGKKKSTKCPTCIDELKHTINQVPHIQKTKSFLICPYTNEVMDEKNPPFTTPRGHVFSGKAISLFMKSEGIFQCPITEEKYCIQDLSRLFI